MLPPPPLPSLCPPTGKAASVNWFQQLCSVSCGSLEGWGCEGGGCFSPELEVVFCVCVLFSIRNAPSDSLTASRWETAPLFALRSLTSLMHYSHLSFKRVPSTALPPSSATRPSLLIMTNYHRHFGNKCIGTALTEQQEKKLHWLLRCWWALGLLAAPLTSLFFDPPPTPHTPPLRQHPLQKTQKMRLHSSVFSQVAAAAQRDFGISTKLHRSGSDAVFYISNKIAVNKI